MIKTIEEFQEQKTIDNLDVNCYKEKKEMVINSQRISNCFKLNILRNFDLNGKVYSSCHHDIVSTYFDILNEGLHVELSIPSTDEKPKWFNLEEFRLGQIFAEKYFSCINFAEMISLFLLFTYNLEALMFTNKSGTPYNSFKRYLSTVLMVKSWYNSDLFNPNSSGSLNIKRVRMMHKAVDTAMSELSHQRIIEIIDQNNDRRTFRCPLYELIRDDFKNSNPSACPFMDVNFKNWKYFFNQSNMSITQFGFVGLIVTYPEKLGAGTATEEELNGFIHVWRTIGYLLGIEDKYNFCNGSLQNVRQRTKALIDYHFIPNFLNVDKDWEHYSRCLVKGISYYIPNVTFESSLLYLHYVLNLKYMKRFTNTLSWNSYFHFYFQKFVFEYLFKFQFILDFFNKLINFKIDLITNITQHKQNNLKDDSDRYMSMST